jgi:putative transposase
MNTLPFQFLLMTLAGWVNRSQRDVIEYLQEENWVLREHLGGRRLLFTDVQRRRLAARAERISRRTLSGIGPIVTPDTLLRWYRTLVARDLTPLLGPVLMQVFRSV